MSKTIQLKLTNIGISHCLNAETSGIKLELDRIVFSSDNFESVDYDPHTEIKNIIHEAPIAVGGKSEDQRSLRFVSYINSPTELEIRSLGIYTKDNVLFAVASVAAGNLFKVYNGVSFVAAFGMSIAPAFANVIEIKTDQNAALALVMMNDHERHANPHPQYAQQLNNLVKALYHVNSWHGTNSAEYDPAIALLPLFGYETTWTLWPYVPKGVGAIQDPIGAVSGISSGANVQIASTRIWQRLEDGATGPTYSLMVDKNSVNEGDSLEFTLQTTGLAAGTPVDWTITGVQTSDILPAALTGQFVVDATGKAKLSVQVVEDNKTDGNKTLILALTYIKNKQVSAFINDTSKYPEGQEVYYQGTHSINVEPNQIIVIDMYAPGGGGGGSIYSGSSQNPVGKDGGNNILALGEVQFIAGGGKAGTGGVWGNGSSFTNGEAGTGGINTIADNPQFIILENKKGNSAVIGSRWSRQPGGAGILSSIGTLNGGGAGGWGIGDEKWSYGGGGGGGGRLKVQFTNTNEDPITLNLVIGAFGAGWKGAGNAGDDGGIGFAIVNTL